MPDPKPAISLESVLPEGSSDYISIQGHVGEEELAKTTGQNTDIVRMDVLNNGSMDCTFHPDGYCLYATSTYYNGPMTIGCQPPFAYIRYQTKTGCA
jgi:hypothetical protein